MKSNEFETLKMKGDDMKKLLLLVPFLLFACSGISIDDSNVGTVSILAEITARNIGCEVSRDENSELIDRALQNIYQSVVAGELTEDAIKQLSEYTKTRPTLAADVASLIKLLGVNTEADTIVVDQVPPEVLSGIESGYVQGIELCKE